MGNESRIRRERRNARDRASNSQSSPIPVSNGGGNDGWPPIDATIRFSVSQYETFFRIARASYRKLKEVQEREIDMPTGSTEGPNLESMRRSSYEQRQRFAAVAVVFSALTLESFINHYGSLLGADVFKKLDRKSNAEKWRLFPELRCGKTLASGGTAMEGIKAIFKIRDQLVHDKPHSFTFGPDSDPKDFTVLSIDLATKTDPIKHVCEALDELKQIDPAVEISWAFEKELNEWNLLL